MLQELRDYWLPLMLFVGALFVAAFLLLLIVVLPPIVEYLQITQPMLILFAEDAVVRRSSIAGAIGLIVTAFVFFRPRSSVLSQKASTKKLPGDTMAGA